MTNKKRLSAEGYQTYKPTLLGKAFIKTQHTAQEVI